MSNLRAIRVAILEYVDAMKAAGKVVDVDATAIRLSTKYPQSGLTLDEIAADIARAAANNGAALLSGAKAGRSPDVQAASELDKT